MYKTNNRGPRRPGTRHFGPNTRNHRPKNNQPSIDPARFVKRANPSASSDYSPVNSFDDFAIHPLLKSNVAAMGYQKPSEIQDKTIPLGLAGADVVGIANTGTGKTAAFALPILSKLLREPSARALVIAPTRELAIQIEQQFRLFAKNSGLNAVLVIGGLPINRQKNDLKNQPRLVIGTPGRIKDHLGQGTLSLGHFKILVLDEVDRMLDMGFIQDVRFILDQLHEQHQSFFFSATLSAQIKALIETFTHDPQTVNVKQGETSDNVDQNVVNYGGGAERIDLLHDLLIGDGQTQKTLIFGKTKYGVERLSKELKSRGFAAEALHGGKSQGQRRRALDGFRGSLVDVLVATDVAARGIDVVEITHVINYDLPQSYDDYIHRIGRAGRAGRTGHALTFVESLPTLNPTVQMHPYRTDR